jgi:hypothetical protein
MDKKSKITATYNTCTGPQQHCDHLCHLMEKGLTEEVRRRSDRPAFLCANCGARANEAVDLCNPEALKP